MILASERQGIFKTLAGPCNFLIFRDINKVLDIFNNGIYEYTIFSMLKLLYILKNQDIIILVSWTKTFQEEDMYEVAVIGCGVVGLTSALAIQERLKNVKVTIFTKDVSPNTTGDIAAGHWTPYLVGNTPVEKVFKWSKTTYDYLLKSWKEGNYYTF